MLNYWYMNDLVRPAHRPYSRNNLPQPWVGRVIAQHKRDCIPQSDDEDYQSWDQHLDRHSRDQILQLHENQVAIEAEVARQEEAALQFEAEAYLQSLDAEVDRYSPSPAHGHPVSDEEDYALQVEQEFVQLRAPPLEPGTLLKSFFRFSLRIPLQSVFLFYRRFRS